MLGFVNICFLFLFAVCLETMWAIRLFKPYSFIRWIHFGCWVAQYAFLSNTVISLHSQYVYYYFLTYSVSYSVSRGFQFFFHCTIMQLPVNLVTYLTLCLPVRKISHEPPNEAFRRLELDVDLQLINICSSGVLIPLMDSGSVPTFLQVLILNQNAPHTLNRYRHRFQICCSFEHVMVYISSEKFQRMFGTIIQVKKMLLFLLQSVPAV